MEGNSENGLSRWSIQHFDKQFKSKSQANKVAKRVMNDQQYLQYRGLRPSCRITVPLLSVQNIREAAIAFRRLAKALDGIQKQSGLDPEQRVQLAQSETTACTHYLKYKAQRTPEVDRPGTFNNVR